MQLLTASCMLHTLTLRAWNKSRNKSNNTSKPYQGAHERRNRKLSP